jgi:hypothetical protein
VGWLRRRQQRRQRAETERVTGRVRLADGDVVPVPGHRRFADILNEETREFPTVADMPDPLDMTPAQEHRSGRRRWLP